MKLRSILRVLSLLAFISASAVGYQYYRFLTTYAFQEIERKAVTLLQTTKKNLSAFFSENTKPVRVMAKMQPFIDALTLKNQESLEATNSLLDHFQKTLDVDVCYLIDRNGVTIASSNRNAPDSFVGMDYSFRPYFQDAIAGLPANYLALGMSSRKRGAYYSYPIYREGDDTPVGIAVIKASIFYVEKELTPEEASIQLVVDPMGVIFISSEPDWLYHLLWQLNPDDIRQIETSKQFGTGPWKWTGIRKSGDNRVIDASKRTYLFHQISVDNYPGWKIVHLYDLETALRTVSAPVSKIILPFIVIVCSLLGISIFILYRQASLEIERRRTIQRALEKSEERYRSLYHNTPAMLHSVNENGTLVSVSNYWCEALEYERDEVIGKKFTDYLSPDLRKLAEEEIIPAFFEKGFIKEVPYKLVKKNDDIIEVLLSAIADRDEQKNTVRSLAISIDVTERNKAEKALKAAKEDLSRYSKNLESQVRKRTREITGILRYTPSVIYIKGANGRYTMVNSRFEELFGIQSSEVREKTDQDFLSPDMAEQFQKNDDRVLRQKKPIQVEESIVINNHRHVFLSTKFPLYDGKKFVTGVCGILTDITELKKTQARLRQLSASIMDGQEKEWAYLARELHDEVGQILTALRMDAVWIRDRVKESNPKVSGRALTMCELIDTTIEEVRGLAIRLRPGVLDHLGLVAAIEWFAADFEKRYSITCVVNRKEVPKIPGNIATAAYRITQEALTNVARHSTASHVQVTMTFTNGLFKLSVSDNGKGFNPERLEETDGLGVINMKERANLVGGKFGIKSDIGKGTRIRFTVPLDKDERP